jgi:peptidoglycan-N-acetylglucosamine deacetylase
LPSFSEQHDILRSWTRFPSRQRLDPPEVALTFDDGPDPDATPAVLDALEAIDRKATFFMVGEQVEAHPELARAVVDRGHEVGLHGQRHLRPHLLADPQDDLTRARSTIAEATGTTPVQFRPPYGAFDDPLYTAATELGLEPVLWSAWGLDWEPIPAERIAEVALQDLTPGAILLLHDSARYAPRPSALPTAEALPLIAAAL